MFPSIVDCRPGQTLENRLCCKMFDAQDLREPWASQVELEQFWIEMLTLRRRGVLSNLRLWRLLKYTYISQGNLFWLNSSWLRCQCQLFASQLSVSGVLLEPDELTFEILVGVSSLVLRTTKKRELRISPDIEKTLSSSPPRRAQEAQQHVQMVLGGPLSWLLSWRT